MRPVTRRHLRHPAGTCHRQLLGLRYGEDGERGTLVYEAHMDVFDDGP